MKLVQVKESALSRFMKTTSNKEIIDEFIESGMKCAEVTEYSCKNAYVCAASLNSSIKRYRVFNVKAVSRNNRVYLVREEI